MVGTLTYTGTLTITSCWCGIQLAIPRSLYEEAHRHEKSVYCPLGHTFIYNGRTDQENRKLRERLELEQSNTNFWREQHDSAERRAAAQRGVTTKLKKRIAAGVCPCCKRTFQDLGRHMKGQHPDYAEPDKRKDASR